MDRRTLLAGAGIALGAAATNLIAQAPSESDSLGQVTKHELPPLPYAFNALEPFIDAQTMELHYSKHHKAYVDGLNKAEAELAKCRAGGNYALVQHWSRQCAFHGGGHFLHSLFWTVMAPAGGKEEPTGPLLDAIRRDFGSTKAFKAQFSDAATSVEGSGWALLHLRHSDNRLVVLQAENQQKLSQWGTTPLMGIDVWEHAYYLKYQNRRAEYVKAWWNVVNWDEVSRRYVLALGAK